MYYQVEAVLSRPSAAEPAFLFDSTARGASTVNLERTLALTVTYFAYFPSEEGLGAHFHDIEPVEMRLLVIHSSSSFAVEQAGAGCTPGRYVLAVSRTTGKAHGLVWF